MTRIFLKNVTDEWKTGNQLGAARDVALTLGPDAAAGGLGAGVIALTTPEDDPNRMAKIAGGAAVLAGGRRGVQRINRAVEYAPKVSDWRTSGLTGSERTMSARRATQDFGRVGTGLRLANAFVIFASASTAGSLTIPRALRRDPGAVLPRLAVLGGVAALAYAHNETQFPDEWRDIKENEKRSNFIVIMGNGTPNESGKPGFSRIPRISIPVRDNGVVTNPVNYAMDHINQNNPEAIQAFAAKYLGAYVPVANLIAGKGEVPGANLVMPILKEPLQRAANLDFYTGKPIESRDMQGLPEGERYYPWTSALARGAFGDKLREMFGWSPAETDHTIQAFFGSTGRIVTGLGNEASGRPSDTPPIVGGLLSGVYRNTPGGRMRDAPYEEFERQLPGRQEEIRALVRQNVPGWDQKDRRDQEKDLRSLEAAMEQDLRLEVGITGGREPGQPWRWRDIGENGRLGDRGPVVTDLQMDARLSRLFSRLLAKDPTLTDTEINLITRYRQTDDYQRWNQGERVEQRERTRMVQETLAPSRARSGRDSEPAMVR